MDAICDLSFLCLSSRCFLLVPRYSFPLEKKKTLPNSKQKVNLERTDTLKRVIIKIIIIIIIITIMNK